jgi:hypothetical protein
MGAVVGGLTLLVKPAGLVLIPIFCLLWTTELLAKHRPFLTQWRNNRTLRRYSAGTACLLATLFTAVTVASLRSEYLSSANLSLGYAAQKIVIDMYKGVPLLGLVSSQIQASLGWHWLYAAIAAALFVLGGIVVRAWRRCVRPEDFRFLAALAALGIGIVWWVELAGPAQIRYLYPFLTIFLVILLPEVLAHADVALPRWVRRVLAIVCVAPLGAIIAMLFMDAPPVKAQLLAGVNLSTGQFSHEVKLGDMLTGQIAQQGRTLSMYILPPDERPAVVEAETGYFALLHPDAHGLQTRHPQDWIHPTTIRRAEFAQADFVLFDPVRDEGRLRALLAEKTVNDSGAESDVLSALLTKASTEEGLQVLADNDMRLVKVINPAKLEEVFERIPPRSSARYEGNLERADCDTISGWAWNAVTPEAVIGVQIFGDGQLLTTLTAEGPRPDLLAAGKGNGAHAFAWKLPALPKDGRAHSIGVRAGGSDYQLANSPRLVTCR